MCDCEIRSSCRSFFSASFVAMAASTETPLALSGTASAILSFTSLLDEYGAETWNLRIVALVAASFFLLIRLFFGKKGGVDWYPLTHATVTGIGAALCMYLDIFWAETMTGLPGMWSVCRKKKSHCQYALTELCCFLVIFVSKQNRYGMRNVEHH